MKNTTQNTRRGQWDAKHEAWMSIFSRDCSIYTNYKTFLISDLQYKIDILTLVTYQMMHTWGNAIFQKGECLFHLNLKKTFTVMYYSIASQQTEILK